jgi:hypothetical protein
VCYSSGPLPEIFLDEHVNNDKNYQFSSKAKENVYLNFADILSGFKEINSLEMNKETNYYEFIQSDLYKNTLNNFLKYEQIKASIKKTNNITKSSHVN